MLFVLAETLGFRCSCSASRMRCRRVADACRCWAAALARLAGFLDLGLPEAPTRRFSLPCFRGSALAVLGQVGAAHTAGRTVRWSLGARPRPVVRIAGRLLGTLAGCSFSPDWLRCSTVVFEAARSSPSARCSQPPGHRRARPASGRHDRARRRHAMSWFSCSVMPRAPRPQLDADRAAAALAAVAIWIARRAGYGRWRSALAASRPDSRPTCTSTGVVLIRASRGWSSLVALELATACRARIARHAACSATAMSPPHGGLCCSIAQTPAYLGLVSARLLIDVFALAGLRYWCCSGHARRSSAGRGVANWHTPVLELMLVGVTVTS